MTLIEFIVIFSVLGILALLVISALTTNEVDIEQNVDIGKETTTQSKNTNEVTSKIETNIIIEEDIKQPEDISYVMETKIDNTREINYTPVIFISFFLILSVAISIIIYKIKTFKKYKYLKLNTYYLKDILKCKKIKSISDEDCKYLIDECNKKNFYAIQVFEILENYDLIKSELTNNYNKINVVRNGCSSSISLLIGKNKEYELALILYLIFDKNLNLKALLEDLSKLNCSDKSRYINNLAILYSNKIIEELLFIRKSTISGTLEDSVLEFNEMHENDIPINISDIIDLLKSSAVYTDSIDVNINIIEETIEYLSYKYENN